MKVGEDKRRSILTLIETVQGNLHGFVASRGSFFYFIIVPRRMGHDGLPGRREGAKPRMGESAGAPSDRSAGSAQGACPANHRAPYAQATIAPPGCELRELLRNTVDNETFLWTTLISGA